VRRLNAAGVPVVAWLLLPKEQGYWFNAENSGYALDRYEHFGPGPLRKACTGRVWVGYRAGYPRSYKPDAESRAADPRLIPRLFMCGKCGRRASLTVRWWPDTR